MASCGSLDCSFVFFFTFISVFFLFHFNRLNCPIPLETSNVMPRPYEGKTGRNLWGKKRKLSIRRGWFSGRMHITLYYAVTVKMKKEIFKINEDNELKKKFNKITQSMKIKTKTFFFLVIISSIIARNFFFVVRTEMKFK